MENEIMNNYEENEVMVEEVVADGGSSIGTAAAMAIGAGLAFAFTAGAKLVKKGIAAYKEKKALHKPDEPVDVDPAKVAEIATPEE